MKSIVMSLVTILIVVVIFCVELSLYTGLIMLLSFLIGLPLAFVASAKLATAAVIIRILYVLLFKAQE